MLRNQRRCAADRRLCLSHMQKAGFLMTWLILSSELCVNSNVQLFCLISENVIKTGILLKTSTSKICYVDRLVFCRYRKLHSIFSVRGRTYLGIYMPIFRIK